MESKTPARVAPKKATGPWSTAMKGTVSAIMVALMVGVLVVFILFLTKVNYYVHATRPGCNSTVDDTPPKCCCPDGAALELDCDEPRDTMHKTLRDFFRWPAWIALSGQIAIMIMGVTVIAIYVPKTETKGGKKFLMLIFAGIALSLYISLGVMFCSAYSEIQHSEWPVFWGEATNGQVTQYTIANNGTANCYNQWYAADSKNAGKTGPTDLKSLALASLILWGTQSFIFTLFLTYVVHYTTRNPRPKVRICRASPAPSLACTSTTCPSPARARARALSRMEIGDITCARAPCVPWMQKNLSASSLRCSSACAARCTCHLHPRKRQSARHRPTLQTVPVRARWQTCSRPRNITRCKTARPRNCALCWTRLPCTGAK